MPKDDASRMTPTNDAPVTDPITAQQQAEWEAEIDRIRGSDTESRKRRLGQYLRGFNGAYCWTRCTPAGDLDAILAAIASAPACAASPDHADIMETIENASDDWQKQGYPTALAEVRDMANVGRSLLERIADHSSEGPLKGWHPADCPTEVVCDLLNMLADASAPAGSREAAMVTLRTDEAGRPKVWCDPEIADLIDALNTERLSTVASCSGHGHRPGIIMLADGRCLMVFRDREYAKAAESAYPLDINGVASAPAGDAFADAGKPIAPAGDGVVGQLSAALQSGTWPEVIAALRAVRTDEEIRDELCVMIPQLHRWASGAARMRPMAEKGMRAAIAEWIGIPNPAAALARPRAAVGEQNREAIEAECAALIAAYYRRKIGTLMQQAQHWAENGKPLAVHHRVMKADDYFQIVCQMERDPAKGWKLPFDEIRDALGRKPIKEPGTYPPSKGLYRYRDPSFVVAALQSPPAKVEG